jgi:hypothetical protein
LPINTWDIPIVRGKNPNDEREEDQDGGKHCLTGVAKK